jgi:hypothetical protein
VQTTLGENSIVPYFLMPSLGGGRSLRAYSSWRFRDRNTLLTTIEWRWIPSRLGLDMAIFYDVGKVASRYQDLNFDNLTSDWGFGARFHAPQVPEVVVLRMELAKGNEGWQFVIGSSAPF